MPTPTAIRDRSPLTWEDLRDHLRLSTNRFQTVLERKLAAAKAAADLYCQNDFLDAEGEEADIPPDVDEWVLTYAARLFVEPDGPNDQVSMEKVGVYKRNHDDNILYRPLKPHRRTPKAATRGGGN